MKDSYQKIVAAIEKKADALCPESLALIGVYGSCATGDVHPKSDLDLLILIKDEKGRCLADAFILDDVDIGFDLYCTTWDMLERDAECHHSRLAKLLDVKLLCIKDPLAAERLKALQDQAMSVLASPQRFARAFAAWEKAKVAYADVCLSDTISQVRIHTAESLDYGFDALMLYHGRYFSGGTKRMLEELATIGFSFDIKAMTEAVIKGETSQDICNALGMWMRTVSDVLKTTATPQMLPCRDNLSGTYEEMFSNWRNKMWEAANRGDQFSSFANLASLAFMLEDIANGVAIRKTDVMRDYSPRDLYRNAQSFDDVLEKYLAEYARAGIEPRRFADAQTFLKAYTAYEETPM